jgi:Sulfotransferase domain
MASYFYSLGLAVLHFDTDLTAYMPHSSMMAGVYSNEGSDLNVTRTQTTWRGIYDDVDAVFDLPTAYFYKELLQEYPDALFICTYRGPPDKWFTRFSHYLTTIRSAYYANQSMPVYVDQLHKYVYGSVEPQRKLWIDSYERHYASVWEAIPESHLLYMTTENISARAIVQFLGMEFRSGQTPPIRRVYGLDDIKNNIALGRQAGTFQDQVPRLDTHLSYVPAAQSKYAYVTLLADIEANSFKESFFVAVLVWCKSIHDSYKDFSGGRAGYNNGTLYDTVLLVVGDIRANRIEELYTCFDRVILLPDFPGHTRGVAEDTRYNAVIRSKFWAFGMTEYRRVQFIDADVMVVRNIDHYFFRDFYDAMSEATSVAGASNHTNNYHIAAPKTMYAQVSSHSPVCSAFMSFEPSTQSVIDIYALLQVASWNNVTGWMDFGPFSFDSWSLVESFSDARAGWKLGQPDELLPQLPLTPHPTRENPVEWQTSPWNFYCSWSDQGMVFYYFYLLKQSGGFIDPSDHDHELVHFVSIASAFVNID